MTHIQISSEKLKELCDEKIKFYSEKLEKEKYENQKRIDELIEKKLKPKMFLWWNTNKLTRTQAETEVKYNFYKYDYFLVWIIMLNV